MTALTAFAPNRKGGRVVHPTVMYLIILPRSNFTYQSNSLSNVELSLLGKQPGPKAFLTHTTFFLLKTSLSSAWRMYALYFICSRNKLTY